MEAAENNFFDNIMINKNKVFSVIGLSVNSPVYNQTLKEYYNAEKLFKEHINVNFQYCAEKNDVFQCSHIIYSGITLGNNVSECISGLFEQGNYTRALILNAVCDDFIMQADNILRCAIANYCTSLGLNTVKIYFPHENIEPHWSMKIAKKLGKLNLKVNSLYNIEPEKTLIYIVSADKEKKGNIIHKCIDCRTNCKWKQ